jgi:hypothetical protein
MAGLLARNSLTSGQPARLEGEALRAGPLADREDHHCQPEGIGAQRSSIAMHW